VAAGRGPGRGGQRRPSGRAPCGRSWGWLSGAPIQPCLGQKRGAAGCQTQQLRSRLRRCPSFRGGSKPAADFFGSRRGEPVRQLKQAFSNCQVVSGRAQHALPGARRITGLAGVRPVQTESSVDQVRSWFCGSVGQVFELRRASSMASRPGLASGPALAAVWIEERWPDGRRGPPACRAAPVPLQLAGGMMHGSVPAAGNSKSSCTPGQLKEHGGAAQLAPRSRPSGAWSRAVCVSALDRGGCWRPPNAAGPWPKG